MKNSSGLQTDTSSGKLCWNGT